MTLPARWTSEHVRHIAASRISFLPLIGGAFQPVGSGVGIWDAWPVQDKMGKPLQFGGQRELWMALGARRFADPDDRHAHARIHLLLRERGNWHDLGPTMPDGFTPGSREWSGSAVAEADGKDVTLYFTAAGRRGEGVISFEQRMFSAVASIDTTGDIPRLLNWRNPQEIAVRDPAYYMETTGGTGEPGKIKAFRDPAFFHDPLDGQDYLLFAGSRAGSTSSYNGVIGIARRESASRTSWSVLPPLISADALNNELERPHIVLYDNLYYLFWSTQHHVFDPAGPVGPTGLYGMVAASLFGRWQPLNGSGLVLANPYEAPAQAYSWLVLPDLSVASFVDDWDVGTERSFGGAFAPFVRLKLAGDQAGVSP